jgi:feruloyl esterase
VLAGSAAFSYARVTAADLWVARTNIIDGQPVLQARQFALLRQAALAQCDALDGAVDGELSNPRACRLDTAKLQCAAGRSAGCLTPEQIAVADKLYAGMRNPRSGAWLWNGMLPGGENAYVGAATTPFALAQDFFRYMVFHRADWDYTQLDFGGDIEHAEKLTADILARPDLRDFGRHGKLIQYAGWNENTPPPEDAIDYYDAAAARAGGLAAESRFHKLFVVPNGNHCRGGYSAPWFTALTRWVEADSPPDGLIANRLGTAAAGTEAPVIGQRPLCAYPMVARYRGAGDINSAESFECVAAPLGTRRSAAQ